MNGTGSTSARTLSALVLLGALVVALWRTQGSTRTGQRPIVISEEGNIVATRDDGRRVQLTKSGRDQAPQLSPDGTTVVFRRATQGRLVFAGYGEEEANELWLVNVDGSGERLLLRGEDRNDPLRRTWDCDLITAGFVDPQFSHDGRKVFFQGYCAATSHRLWSVDLATRGSHTFPVALGGDAIVLHDTEYAGHLIVPRRSYHEGGGAFVWYYLFDPNGREIAALGDCDQIDEDSPCPRRLFDDWLRDGKISPPTPR